MNKNILSLLWVFFEKLGGTIISIITFFYIATVLSTKEIGIATIVLSAAVGLGQVYSSIYTDNLICKKKVTTKFVSCVFIGGLFISFLLSGFLLAFFSLLTDDSAYYTLMMSACLCVPFAFVNSLYCAFYRRNSMFKSYAKVILVAKIISSVIAMTLAYEGFGYYSLVMQALSMELISLMGLSLFYKITIVNYFNYKQFKAFFNNGLPLCIRKLSWESYIKGLPILIGATLGPVAVGIYTFAWRVIDMPRTALVSGSVSFVLPLLAKCSTRDEFSNLYLRASKLSFACFTPLFLGLCLTAGPLINFTFDGKWDKAIPLIQGLSLITLISFTRVYIPSLLVALKSPGLSLKTDIAASLVSLAVFLLTFSWLAEFTIILSYLIRTIFTIPITTIVVKNKLSLSFFEQYFVFFHIFIALTLMALSMFIFKEFIPITVITFPFYILLGSFIYVATVLFFDKKILTFKNKREYEK